MKNIKNVILNLKNVSSKQITFATLIIILFIPMYARSANTAYDKITQAMQNILTANPQVTESISLGKSDAGMDILGIKITPQNNKYKIQHLVVGTHHGNEGVTANLAIVFINDILKILKDPANPLYSKYQNLTFHVFPVLNISGFNSNSRYEKAKSSSYDPNRDYPDACIEKKNYNLKSTYLLSQYLQYQNIVGALTLHGFIGTFTYPWGTYATNTHTLDDVFFSNVSNASVVYNRYKTGTHTDVIYPTAGAFEDWAYFEHGIWTNLVEMSNNANLNNDSKMMLAYFALLPETRSDKHSHGDCKKVDLRYYLYSRP